MRAALSDELRPGDDGGGWKAELDLRYVHDGRRTVVGARRHTGPLLVQRAFYPEGGVCHSYVVHPPGGIVGGDTLVLRVDAAEAAHVVLTTPAATKFYRSEGLAATQRVELRGRGARLEWLPQETLLYPAARAQVATVVDLDDRSRFIGWEITCLGLPSQGRAFSHGSARLALDVVREGAPVLLDRVQLGGADDALAATWGLRGLPVLGTLVALPADEAMLGRVRTLLEGQDEPRQECAATLVDGVLLVRALAQHADRLRRCFVRVWETLRPALMGCPAHAPRIWAT